MTLAFALLQRVAAHAPNEEQYPAGFGEISLWPERGRKDGGMLLNLQLGTSRTAIVR